MIKIKEILGKRYFHLVSSEEPLAGTLGTKEKSALMNFSMEITNPTLTTKQARLSNCFNSPDARSSPVSFEFSLKS